MAIRGGSGWIVPLDRCVVTHFIVRVEKSKPLCLDLAVLRTKSAGQGCLKIYTTWSIFGRFER